MRIKTTQFLILILSLMVLLPASASTPNDFIDSPSSIDKSQMSCEDVHLTADDGVTLISGIVMVAIGIFIWLMPELFAGFMKLGGSGIFIFGTRNIIIFSSKIIYLIFNCGRWF